MTNQSPILFISHNSLDKEFIDTVAKQLSDKHDVQVWLDKWSLVGATDWAPAIEKALETCSTCAVMLGANGWGPHHLGEAQLALKRKREFPDFRVIPVLLPGASAANMEVLGDFFQQTHRVKFDRKGDEKEAFQQLLATINGEAPGPPLMTLYKIERDAKYWQRLPVDNKGGALYAGEKLREASEIVKEEQDDGVFKDIQINVIQEFLHAGKADEQKRIRDAAQLKNRIIAGLVMGLVVIGIVAAFAILQRNAARAATLSERDAREAETTQRKKAEEQQRLAVKARDDATTAKDKEIKAREAESEQRKKAEEQRILAEQQEQLAIEQKELAQARELRNRHLLYAANIDLASQAYDDTNIDRGQQLLESYLEQDQNFRGFEWYYLWRLFHRNVFEINPGSGSVSAIAYTPDARYLAYSTSYEVRLWETQTKKELPSVREDESIRSLAFAKDNKTLAIALDNGKVDLLEVPGLTPVRLLAGKDEFVTKVSFSPGGNTLAVGAKGIVRLFDVVSRSEKRVLQVEGNFIGALAFSPDGSILAAGGASGIIKFWNAKTFDELTTIRGHSTSAPVKNFETAVNALAFSPDGKLLASGSNDTTSKVWNTGNYEEIATFPANKGGVQSVSFSMDGSVLAVGSWGGEVSIWDVASRKQFAILKGHGPTAMVHGTYSMDQIVHAVAFSPDRLTLAVASGVIKLWDITQLREFRTFDTGESSVNFVTFSPGDKYLAAVNGDVVVWNTDSHTVAKTIDVSKEFIKSVSFSGDGRYLASASSKAVRIWDSSQDFKQTAVIEWSIPEDDPGAFNPSAVAFSPDGRTLIVGGERGTQEINSLDDGPQTFPGHGVLKILNARDFKEVLERVELLSPISTIAFSPDGKLFAAGTDTGETAIYDAVTNRVLKILEGEGNAMSLAFSPDGKKLAVSNYRVGVVLWDTRTGRRLSTIKEHREFVNGVSFSADGNTLATAGVDKTVRLWDTTNFRELLVFKEYDSPIRSLAFSRSGKILATGTEDGQVELWPAASKDEVVAYMTRKSQNKR